jgi:hypothetical protein
MTLRLRARRSNSPKVTSPLIQRSLFVWPEITPGFRQGVWILMEATAEEQQKPPAQKTPDRATELKALLREQCDTLSKLVDVLLRYYEIGRVDFARLAQAEREALKATVELDDSPQNPLAALQKVRDMATKVAQVTETRFKSGLCSEADVLQARAALLEARIELLREELKAQPAK